MDADGTICDGEAAEESAVWQAPIAYRLAEGAWESASGRVSFLLVHADERSRMFDPFFFELTLQGVGARRRGRKAADKKAAGSNHPRHADREEHEEQELAPRWEAVSGWWNTSDGDGRGGGGGASCARMLWPSAPQGSYGRIVEMNFRRLSGD